MNIGEIQGKCHFVLFKPPRLPADLALKEESFRKETDTSESTFRQVYEGNGRAMVMKQFLYDWDPPAYDYPSLWRDQKLAAEEEIPPPAGFLIGSHALWIGKNYRLQNGATIEIDRTRIEFTFPKGEFSAGEIVNICKGLVPIDLKRRVLLLSQSFGQLSYQSRHLIRASGVPTSFWKHQRDKSLYCFLLEGHGGLPKHFIDVLVARGYLFNTRFGFGASVDQIAESEYIFEHESVPGAFIRLLTPISYPPHFRRSDLFFNRSLRYFQTILVRAP